MELWNDPAPRVLTSGLGIRLQYPTEMLSCVRSLVPRDLLGRTFHNNSSSLVTRFRPQVNHPIGAFDDVEVMFDDDDRIPCVDQGIEAAQELGDIIEVKACRRFIKDEQRVAVGRR